MLRKIACKNRQLQVTETLEKKEWKPRRNEARKERRKEKEIIQAFTRLRPGVVDNLCFHVQIFSPLGPRVYPKDVISLFLTYFNIC